ncbi:hypothetical protein Emag_004210 [Eimeria magna]
MVDSLGIGSVGAEEQREPLVRGSALGSDVGANERPHTPPEINSFSEEAAPQEPLAYEAARQPLLPADAPAAAEESGAAAGAAAEAGEAVGLEGSTRRKRKNVCLALAFTALNTLFLACAQGPVFDMYLFILGNKSNRWVGDAESLSGVVALLVAAPVGILVDKYSRGNICKDEARLPSSPAAAAPAAAPAAAGAGDGPPFPLEPERDLAAAVSTDGAAEVNEAAAEPQGDDDPLSTLSLLHRSVPYVISVSDFVRSMGAGMTVKFFPLFFFNEYHLTPIQLCQLGFAYALSIVLFVFVAEKLAKLIGRASASQLLSLLGLIMLVAMCLVKNLPFLILTHLIRGGMQNANYPIDRSIVMDFTKSKDRGKWSAVETFTSTMWSGSAFLGGIMADTDYRLAFGVTAGMYAVAWLVYAPLVFIVPKAERAIGLSQRSPAAVVPAASAANSTASFNSLRTADAANSFAITATTATTPASPLRASSPDVSDVTEALMNHKMEKTETCFQGLLSADSI